MTTFARMARTLTITIATCALALCTTATANAETEPDLPGILAPTSSGTAPTIATAIAIGLIAIATLTRAAQNYLHGQQQTKITPTIHDTQTSNHKE